MAARQIALDGSSAGGSKLTNALATDGVGDLRSAVLPANYQPVESAWYIPGPTALVDSYTAAPNTTGSTLRRELLLCVAIAPRVPCVVSARVFRVFVKLIYQTD